MSRRTVSLTAFDDPKSRDFRRAIENAHDTVRGDDIGPFFVAVLGHLIDIRLPVETGKAILVSLQHILCVPDCLEVFVESGYVLSLPFGNRRLDGDVLDVIYILFQRAPEVFDGSVAEQLVSCAQWEPRKVLMFIAFFAQSAEDSEDSQPMLSLLISSRDALGVKELAGEYALVLVSVFARSKTFRKKHRDTTGKALMELLSIGIEDDPTIVKMVYSACCRMVTFLGESWIDVELVKEHFMRDELVPCVIPLLMEAELDMGHFHDPVFVDRVLKVAHASQKASLLLMKLAEDIRVAKYLVSMGSWMGEGLPDILWTLRLFLVVFQKEGLRKAIGKVPEFIRLLVLLAKRCDSCSIVFPCKILSRVPMDARLVKQLSEAKFIKRYLRATNEINSKNQDTRTLESTFKLLIYFSDICFVPELIVTCKYVATQMHRESRNDEIDEVTLILCINMTRSLVQHRQCVAELKELNARKSLKKLLVHVADKEDRYVVQEILAALQ